MTKEEKIIATAFTGKMFIDGTEMGALYEYMEKKVGHGVIDLMLASKEFWEELDKACEQDFIDMVSKEQPSLPSNLDEAAEEYYDEMWDKLGGKAMVVNYEHDIWYPSSVIETVFKAGAEWMAGQGETIDGEVVKDINNNLAITAKGFSGKEAVFGDKVIVQIRKKH